MFEVDDKVRMDAGMRVFRVSAIDDEGITLAYTEGYYAGMDFATVKTEKLPMLTLVEQD